MSEKPLLSARLWEVDAARGVAYDTAIAGGIGHFHREHAEAPGACLGHQCLERGSGCEWHVTVQNQCWLAVVQQWKCLHHRMARA